MERLIIYLERKGAKGRLSSFWKCRECWEKRNTSSHKKLNSLVSYCYNNVTFPAFLGVTLPGPGRGVSAVSDISQAGPRGHHNIFNPCLSLVSSDTILTYWKLRTFFPSWSESWASQNQNSNLREVPSFVNHLFLFSPVCCFTTTNIRCLIRIYLKNI
mgnify:CR=1 FL=1